MDVSRFGVAIHGHMLKLTKVPEVTVQRLETHDVTTVRVTCDRSHESLLRDLFFPPEEVVLQVMNLDGSPEEFSVSGKGRLSSLQFAEEAEFVWVGERVRKATPGEPRDADGRPSSEFRDFDGEAIKVGDILRSVTHPTKTCTVVREYAGKLVGHGADGAHGMLEDTRGWRIEKRGNSLDRLIPPGSMDQLLEYKRPAMVGGTPVPGTGIRVKQIFHGITWDKPPPVAELVDLVIAKQVALSDGMGCRGLDCEETRREAEAWIREALVALDRLVERIQLVAKLGTEGGAPIRVLEHAGPLGPGDLTIYSGGGASCLMLKANGEIWVNGKLAATDKEVVDGMRALVMGTRK